MNRRILHVVNSEFVLNYFFGEQISFFQQNGFEIYIACPDGPIYRRYVSLFNLTFLPLNVTRKMSLGVDILVLLNLVQIIKKYEIDVVIGHTPKGGILGMAASYCVGIKRRIYVRHGLMFETTKGLSRLVFSNVERITSFMSTDVLCVSQSVLNVSRIKYLSHKRKLFIVGRGTFNGVDSRCQFNPFLKIEFEEVLDWNNGSDVLVVGFVGRVVKDKGVEELLDAWRLLRTTRDKIALLIIGPFEDRNSISDEHKLYIESESTIFHVNYTSNVRYYYEKMDIFILPSKREGFPTVNLEASSMGIPVITSTATGCIDSILKNETGIFCEINPISINVALSYYLDNPEIRRIHGKNGRDFVDQNFNNAKVWKDLLNYINMKD